MVVGSPFVVEGRLFVVVVGGRSFAVEGNPGFVGGIRVVAVGNPFVVEGSLRFVGRDCLLGCLSRFVGL